MDLIGMPEPPGFLMGIGGGNVSKRTVRPGPIRVKDNNVSSLKGLPQKNQLTIYKRKTSHNPTGVISRTQGKYSK
jgi:hypothetical protein